MANWSGNKGNRGGAYSRNHGLSIDFSCFEKYAEELDNLGADLTKIFSDVMEDMAEDVQARTKEAVSNSYLPAKGKYRSNPSETMAAIEMNPKPVVSGSIVEINLGFDKSKPGAGGFLITGTPKMAPDYELEELYVKKQYRNKLILWIREALQDEIDERFKRFN